MLRQGVQGISDIITVPGLINLDFADVRDDHARRRSALMGIGRATGENRAVEAARQAIASPLLEVNIAGAQGILFNITGGPNLSLCEVNEAAEEIRAAADPEANIIFGASFNERLGDEVMITVIATGFDGRRRPDHRTASAERSYEVWARPPARASVTSSRSWSGSAARRRPPTATPTTSRATRVSSLVRERGTPVMAPTTTTASQPIPASPAPEKKPTYDADDLEIRPSFGGARSRRNHRSGRRDPSASASAPLWCSRRQADGPQELYLGLR